MPNLWDSTPCQFSANLDAYALEKKLDAIWIGTWKLQVNLPKYSKLERASKTRGDQPRFNRRIRELEQQKKRTTQSGSVWKRREQVQQYLGDKFVLLSCDEEGLIGNLIGENKAWFAGLFISVVPWEDSFIVRERFAWVRCKGFPLQLWSRHCFECVGALVGKVVEVDQATLAREVLEYVRLRVSIPVGGLPCLKKEVSINDISCMVFFEEESSTTDHKIRSFFSKWGDVSIPESATSSEEDDGRDDSVGSFSDVENGRGIGEELTVQFSGGEETKVGKVIDGHGVPRLGQCVYGSLISSKVVEEVNKVNSSIMERESWHSECGGTHAMCHYGKHEEAFNVYVERCVEGMEVKDNVNRCDEDWRAGFPVGNEVGVFNRPGPAAVEAKQFGRAVAGEAKTEMPLAGDGLVRGGAAEGAVMPETSPIKVQGSEVASVADGASRGTGVSETLLEEGERSPMGVEFLNHEGSTLCCQLRTKVRERWLSKRVCRSREVNGGSSLPCLASREVEEINEKVPDLVLSPFNESNLVDVRAVQADLLVQKPTLRTVPIFMLDSAIDNCNRIYR
ncbi:hypothetical protein VNO80_10256 [Phaseolus coccineus]|uniref:DUF4283 domain-containing protein n=1 Tax=Phaseolus coccineus TaxID=3886 RepID=A0AAN9N889_PHACN